jgi:chorismate synthase
MLRWLTAGESHGAALVAILEGLPAGVRITGEEISRDLARRRGGYGRGSRMNFEQDAVRLVAGVRHGFTLGGPVAVEVGNSEWPKWQVAMSPAPVATEELEGLARAAPLTRPRPGHADLAGMQKYGFDDARPVLERASARETAARVALGTLARAFLDQLAGMDVLGHVISIGRVQAPEGTLPKPSDRARLDGGPVRCLDPEASAAMVAEIDIARSEADTLGGVVEVVARGVPPGLGSHVHWDRRLDARLAGALMSIQAMKGVEVGDGFRSAERRGSEAHDEISYDETGVHRLTGRAGGIEGGISTGEPIRVAVAMKPISTLSRPLDTVDVRTGEAAKAIAQRSDVCAVPAAAVVAEAMVALVLAEAVLEKFGGDNVRETRRNLDGYLASLPIR